MRAGEEGSERAAQVKGEGIDSTAGNSDTSSGSSGSAEHGRRGCERILRGMGGVRPKKIR